MPHDLSHDRPHDLSHDLSHDSRPRAGLHSGRWGRSLTQRWDLLCGLVDREIKLLYNRSALGIAWMLINPLMQLAVFAFVFGLILPNNSVENYASFIFSGLLVWTWFQSSLTQATGAIVHNRSLIRQPGFPVAILPVVTVTTGLIHFLLSLPILLLFLLIDGVQLNASIVLLPLLIILQFAFTISLAYVLASINVVFRDTQHTLGVLLQMLFYLSGVFYQVNSLPEKYRAIFYLNPLVGLIESYRYIFGKIGVEASLLAEASLNWKLLGFMGLVTALLLPLGYQIFKRQSERFVEEL
ncbi:MAG: ABC transporter permease [Synechococcales cyanobacterium CRU_2_2]|nr:ABC transporter permease [Synechococcales cyanobacterium CRU_2_2]